MAGKDNVLVMYSVKHKKTGERLAPVASSVEGLTIWEN